MVSEGGNPTNKKTPVGKGYTTKVDTGKTKSLPGDKFAKMPVFEDVRRQVFKTGEQGQYSVETPDGEVLKTGNYAEIEAFIKVDTTVAPGASLTAGQKAEISALLGAAALVADQGAYFDPYGAEGGGDSAMSEEMKAALAPAQQELKKQQLEIKNILTGFGNQCFFMENIEPFVKYATGQKFLLSKQDGDQMIKNLEQFQKQSGGEVREAIDEAMNPDNPARTFSGPRKQGYGYFGSNKTRLKLVSSEKPELIYNALLSDTISGLDDFQRGTPAMYSALVPQIKIFKIF